MLSWLESCLLFTRHGFNFWLTILPEVVSKIKTVSIYYDDLIIFKSDLSNIATPKTTAFLYRIVFVPSQAIWIADRSPWKQWTIVAIYAIVSEVPQLQLGSVV